MSQKKKLISMQSIDKSYLMGDQQLSVLNQLNFDVVTNEYVALVGPSGSGKSTLMNIIGCLDSPTKGKYYLKDKLVSELSENQLARVRNQDIGFVFQNFNLIPRLSTLDNVMRPLIYQGVNAKERRKRALEVLDKVGLSERVDHAPSELSGGQKQRVAIARALVTRPSILLADEPTGNLDSKTTDEIMCLFNQLHLDGITLILVTHESEIAEYCHRVVTLKDGRIVSDV
jgi:putative ABC transport system ATP-binding protein